MNLIKIVTVLVLVLSTSVAASPYVSLKGGFYIEIPEDWEQVTYNVVDAYLSSTNSGREAYEYEAVFAKKGDTPFFMKEYLILKVDKINVKKAVIDSVLTDLAYAYQERISYGSFDDFFKKMKIGQPYFDNATKEAVVKRNILMADHSVKKNLIIYKFPDSAVLSFYFYAPDSTYNATQETFINIYKSYNTENITDMLPEEHLKLADIETESDEPESESSSTNVVLMIVLALGLIVVVISYLKKKRS